MVKSAVCMVVALSLALICQGLERPAAAQGAGQGAGSRAAENVEFVAQIGGAVYGVAVRDGLAYVGRGPRLLLLDVTNPGHPVLVGQTEILPAVVLDVKLPTDEPAGPIHAYVALGASGLGVIDVSNPRAPVMVGSCPTPGSALSLALGPGHLTGHTYAYVPLGDSGLSVIDVTDPLAPVAVGFYGPGEGFLRKAAIAAGAQAGSVYAYVADSWKGLRILDVSTTNNPLAVTLFEISGGSGAEDIAVAQNTAWQETYGYVASPDHGLMIVDVTDSGAPVEVGRFASVDASGVSVIRGESPGDMVAYVAGLDFEVDGSRIGGLGILDVSDPSDPILEDVCKLEASPRNMAVDGGLVYIANGHLDIVDVADAAAATRIGAYGTSANNYSGDLALRGDLACLASYSGLWIVDVANPLRPVDRGSWTGSWWINDVALNGDYAYLSAEGTGLHVIDVSNPALPDRVTMVMLGDTRAVEVPAGEGGALPYAYVANSSRGLIVLDVSDAANPIEVGSSDPVNMAWSVAVTDRQAPGPTYAYVGALWNRVWVLDISDPTRPDVVGDWAQPTLAYDLAVADGYLYAAAGNGLYVADISSPALPIQVSTYPSTVQSVAVAGDYAYLGADGLRVLDVTAPADPGEAGFYETPGGSRDVAVAGPLVYVAAGEGGLVILWFAPPTVASIPAAGGSLDGPFDATTYTFAPGTFTDTVTVTHTPRFFGTMTSTGELVGIRHFFETTAVYSGSGQPVVPHLPFTVTVEYSESDQALAVEETLGLWAWDGEAWGQSGIDSVVEVSKDRVSAQVDRFSLFGVLGEARRMFLPLVLKGD